MDYKKMREEIVSLSDKRDLLTSDIERLRIRKEEAQRNIRELDEKCRSLGVDPSNLDEEIQKLEKECLAKFTDYSMKLASVESKLEGIRNV